MSWRTALTTLSGISVAGVTTSYDLDAVPDALPTADLPALVPQFPAGEGRGGGEDHGLATLTYDGSAWVATLHVDHLLYWAPAWTGRGLMSVLPGLLDAVDDYLDAVSADGTLDDDLQEPLIVERVQVGEYAYGGVTYYGARFRHVWKRVIESV